MRATISYSPELVIEQQRRAVSTLSRISLRFIRIRLSRQCWFLVYAILKLNGCGTDPIGQDRHYAGTTAILEILSSHLRISSSLPDCLAAIGASKRRRDFPSVLGTKCIIGIVSGATRQGDWSMIWQGKRMS